jgi:hypothetical protein
MSQGLTRRGFARTAGAGLAALCLPSASLVLSSVSSPSVASASPPALLVPRFELATDVLELRLFVRSGGAAPVEVLAHAVDVSAELRVNDHLHPLSLDSRGRQTQRVSRAGWRLSRRLVVGTETEVLYDSFTGAWPAVRGTGTLTLRAALRRELQAASEDERGRLASLAGVTAALPVTLPG